MPRGRVLTESPRVSRGPRGQPKPGFPAAPSQPCPPVGRRRRTQARRLGEAGGRPYSVRGSNTLTHVTCGFTHIHTPSRVPMFLPTHPSGLGAPVNGLASLKWWKPPLGPGAWRTGRGARWGVDTVVLGAELTRVSVQAWGSQAPPGPSSQATLLDNSPSAPHPGPMEWLTLRGLTPWGWLG